MSALWSSQVVHASTLEDVTDTVSQPTVIAVAAFFGKVRLIDNLELRD
jgi:pantothenate synthetase